MKYRTFPKHFFYYMKNNKNGKSTSHIFYTYRMIVVTSIITSIRRKIGTKECLLHIATLKNSHFDSSFCKILMKSVLSQHFLIPSNKCLLVGMYLIIRGNIWQIELKQFLKKHSYFSYQHFCVKFLRFQNSINIIWIITKDGFI